MCVIFGPTCCSARQIMAHSTGISRNLGCSRIGLTPRINKSIYGNRERRMRRSAVRLLSLMVTAIFLSAPALSAFAAGGGDPPSPPPPSSDSSKNTKKKGKKTSAIEEQRFADGYRAAYATIY